mmetsp:Transcript_66460/g.105088  ORF Transcript_66460/g.105088 Transcript_66460/m.105088 type:complete len:84 (-) Transcript_66460:1224-1475(-)
MYRLQKVCKTAACQIPAVNKQSRHQALNNEKRILSARFWLGGSSMRAQNAIGLRFGILTLRDVALCLLLPESPTTMRTRHSVI